MRTPREVRGCMDQAVRDVWWFQAGWGDQTTNSLDLQVYNDYAGRRRAIVRALTTE